MAVVVARIGRRQHRHFIPLDVAVNHLVHVLSTQLYRAFFANQGDARFKVLVVHRGAEGQTAECATGQLKLEQTAVFKIG